VRFYDVHDGIWRGGVALNDFIICGCCGAIIDIEDLIKDAVRFGMHFDDVIKELEWIDISDEITGE
jgi:tetrahydromethanopterin S-methyltransferase subunit A